MSAAEQEIVNVEQAQAWDGEEGDHWAAHAARYDVSLHVHNARLQAAAAIAARERVLDVGCGNGVSTRDAARSASAGRAVGIDLSSVMLALARTTAVDEGVTNVEFVHGDAQVYAFDEQSYDVVISRFGVMFFANPIAAFSNLFGAVTPGGRLALVVWKDLAENEWFAEMKEALSIGRDIPPPPPGVPSPFGLADAGFAHHVLASAGFTDIELDPFHAPVYAGDDVDDGYAYASDLGFTRRLLQDLDDTSKRQALDALRATIEAHRTDAGVVFDSACWLITATRP
jgi:SAM-dependent methyltransferase